MEVNLLESLELAHLLVDSILEKKGTEIALLDLRGHSVFADYFLICSGDNDRQLKAIAQEVAFDAKSDGRVLASSIEGDPESGWVLVDFGDLLVHIFLPDQREYYDLEGLWHEAHVILRMQ
jgi:ribosome-associated protein